MTSATGCGGSRQLPVDGDKVLRAETLKEQIIGMVAS
jgi:hypothetical protein